LAQLERRDVVRGESHKTVRPDWVAHSCAPGTYRLLFGTTRACVPARSEAGAVQWEPVQECELVLDESMFGQLRDLLDELSQWCQEKSGEAGSAPGDSTT
jgi:hypothetical protein